MGYGVKAIFDKQNDGDKKKMGISVQFKNAELIPEGKINCFSRCHDLSLFSDSSQMVALSQTAVKVEMC